jgi:5'-nucleotidase / UDP-sugar diphosphatase
MRPAHVTLLFTSDEHGYMKNAARLQSEVQRARGANPDGTLLVSSGDVFEGAVETGVLGLEPSKQLLADAGYDVLTLGNHDFDRGPEVAARWAAEAPCSVLVCNVEQDGKPLPNTRSSQVFDLNGVKMGLIGVTTPETASILPASKLTGVSFGDPATRVAAEVQALQAQGVELIGVVSHLGLAADRNLAAQVGGLDFILGGHTHNALTTPENVNGTLIAHPGCFRQGLGKLELDVDPQSGEILQHAYELVRPETLPEADGPVQQLVHAAEAKVNAVMGEQIATLPKAYRHDPNQLYSEMAELTTEAISRLTGAQVVMLNHKGIRGSLPEGAVRKADVYNVAPFDSRLVTVEMSVAELTKIYQESDRRYDPTSLTTGGTTVIGADCADRSLHLYQEIHPDAGVAEVHREGHGSEFRRLRDDEKVRVATTDYLLQGGLGYVEAKHSPDGDHGTVREILESYLRQQ